MLKSRFIVFSEQNRIRRSRAAVHDCVPGQQLPRQTSENSATRFRGKCCALLRPEPSATRQKAQKRYDHLSEFAPHRAACSNPDRQPLLLVPAYPQRPAMRGCSPVQVQQQIRNRFEHTLSGRHDLRERVANVNLGALCQGADPRQLPTEGHRALHALICLVEAAYHLVRNAEASLKNGDRYQDSRLRENAVELQGKVLISLDIQYIFIEYGSPRARTQFAFRRIVIQRVDRFNVGGKSSKHRFGLTRRFGRHEEKIRFLALLTCANSYPRTARSRNRSLLSPGQAMMSASEFASIRARRFLTESAIAPHRPGQGHALFRGAGNMIAGGPSRFDGCP